VLVAGVLVEPPATCLLALVAGSLVERLGT
jgi:hypothetical protein